MHEARQARAAASRCAGLGRGVGQRLLADDVLAGPQRGVGLLGVQVVGRGEMDDPHAVVGEHRLEGLVGLREGRHARLLARALRGRPDHPDDVDAEPAQRVDAAASETAGR